MADALDVDGLGLLSRREILESLRKDPLLVNRKDLIGDSKDGAPVDYETLLKKESSLNQDLHELNSLRSISGLILEFKANYELVELENCYYSLQNLRRKLRDTPFLVKQSFSFQQSVYSHVDTMHLQLVTKLHEVISKWFWQVNENMVTFNRVVEWGEENFETMEYIPFITSVEQHYYPDGFLDPNIWVVGHMEVGSAQDVVIDKLTSIFRDYLELSLIIDTIKRFVFEKNGKIIWEDLGNAQKLRLERVNNDTVDLRISNILNVVNFIDQSISIHDKPIFVEKLGPLLATELLKTVRSNAHSVLSASESTLKEKVRLVNEKLKHLAKDNRKWNYPGSDVDHLLNDDQVLKNLLLDSIFEDYALKVRDIFKDPSFKKLEMVNTQDTDSSKSRTECQEDSKHVDEWDWGEGVGEDDGWDNEVTTNLDAGGTTQSSKQKDDNKNKVEEIDAWHQEMEINFDSGEDEASQELERFSQKGDEKSEGEGWGWDLDIDDIEASSPDKDEEKAKNPDSMQVSHMAIGFIDIMHNLHKKMQETNRVQLEEDHTYQHKLNVLQTLFFAIATKHFQQDWWQLFINLRYVSHRIPTLTRLQELMSNLLRVYSNGNLKVVTQLVNEQIQQLLDDETHPNYYPTEKKLLPFLRNQIINPLSTIGGEEGTKYLFDFYKCLYVDCINNRILSWNVISEQNSENLAHLVSTIYQKTDTPKLSHNPEYRRYRDKLVMVGRLLQLHLKEIMDMFYNGDFYLFSTEELVQWLVLLFAETPLRQDAIQEIYDIREAAVTSNDK